MTFRLLAFKDAGITASSLTVALISETSIAIDSECRFPFGVLIPFWSVDSFLDCGGLLPPLWNACLG
jgi:hypothetical protein